MTLLIANEQLHQMVVAKFFGVGSINRYPGKTRIQIFLQIL